MNVTGCAVLGGVAVLLAPLGRGALRALVSTGVLGGYTTFSTYALEVVRLLDAEPLRAAVHAAAGVAGGLLGIRAGAALVRLAAPSGRRARVDRARVDRAGVDRPRGGPV